MKARFRFKRTGGVEFLWKHEMDFFFLVVGGNFEDMLHIQFQVVFFCG